MQERSKVMNIKNTCKRLSGPAVLLAALTLAGGLLLPVAGSMAAPADQPPNLGGTWKLNKDKSDNPRQKMQEAMGNLGGMQGGGGTRGGGGGWAQRGRQGRGDRNDFSQLTIAQNGSDIKVTGESGRTLAALPADTNADANADANSNDQYTPPTPTVHWQNTQLIAEMDGRRGGKTTRTYELSPDGKELYVTTTIDNPHFNQPVTYRLVYDPVKSN
jgi:hypothetical protein